jgi:hypothetical protein
MTKAARKRAPGGGRKPKRPTERKSVNMPMRIDVALRSQLETESRRTGLSLSAVIRNRLELSFAKQPLEALAGNNANAGLALLLADLARSAEMGTGGRWQENAFTAATLRAAFLAAFDQLAASGDAVAPDMVRDSAQRFARVTGANAADYETPEHVGAAIGLGAVTSIDIASLPPSAKGLHNAPGLFDYNKIRVYLGRGKG